MLSGKALYQCMEALGQECLSDRELHHHLKRRRFLKRYFLVNGKKQQSNINVCGNNPFFILSILPITYLFDYLEFRRWIVCDNNLDSSVESIVGYEVKLPQDLFNGGGFFMQEFLQSSNVSAAVLLLFKGNHFAHEGLDKLTDEAKRMVGSCSFKLSKGGYLRQLVQFFLALRFGVSPLSASKKGFFFDFLILLREVHRGNLIPIPNQMHNTGIWLEELAGVTAEVRSSVVSAIVDEFTEMSGHRAFLEFCVDLYLDPLVRHLKSIASLPMLPSLLKTGDSYLHDIEKQSQAIAVSLSGGVVISNQHGGCYGSERDTLGEVFERSASDIFVSWGWSGDLGLSEADFGCPENSFCDIRPGFAPSYSHWILVRRAALKALGQQNVVGIVLPRLTPSPVRISSESWVTLKFIEETVLDAFSQCGCACARVVGDVSLDVFSDVLVGRQVSSSEKFDVFMARCRILVFLYNATEFLRCFASDIPCVWISSRHSRFFRREFAEIESMLVEAGVLFGSWSEVEKIYGAPFDLDSFELAWWSENMISLREKIKTRFVRLR